MMDVEAYIMNLAAKKLAGECTEAELDELNKLLAANPGIALSLKSIFTMWEIIDFDYKLTDKAIDDNIALVLRRIHRQIDQNVNHAGK
jgi:hypothetical protein